MGISERQARLFFAGNPEWQKRAGVRPASSPPGVPRAKVNKKDKPENIVEEQICGFLRSRGWILTRNHVGTFVGVGRLMGDLDRGATITKESLAKSGMVRIGEKGTSDWKAERPLRGTGIFGAVQQFYFETKAPGEKPKPHQYDWMRIRASLGFSAAWFDGFEGDGPTKFLGWYRKRFEPNVVVTAPEPEPPPEAPPVAPAF